jgi:hypothetical protein
MKPSSELTKPEGIEAVFLAVVFFCTALLASIKGFAQPVSDKVEAEVNANEAAWYGQPWIWAIGVAMFIIVIAAIFRTASKNE